MSFTYPMTRSTWILRTFRPGPPLLSAPIAAGSTRAYHVSTSRQQKDKKSNLFDKDSINTDATEYSKSGGDGTSAATQNAAFSPDKTRPDEQHDAASREADQQGMSNPLNVSPANHEISQPRKGTEGGAQGSQAETGQGRENRGKTSGGGSSPKAGGGKSGGGGHM